MVVNHPKLWFDIFEKNWLDSYVNMLTPNVMNQDINTKTNATSSFANTKSNNKAKRSTKTATNKNNHIIESNIFQESSYETLMKSIIANPQSKKNLIKNAHTNHYEDKNDDYHKSTNEIKM